MHKHVMAIRTLWTNWHKTTCFTVTTLGTDLSAFLGETRGQEEVLPETH